MKSTETWHRRKAEMLQVSVLRFWEIFSACILGGVPLCFQHMFSASAPPPFGPYPKRIKIWQRWEAEMLKVLTLRLLGRFLVGFWVIRPYAFKILVGHRHSLWSGMNIMSSELRKGLRDGSNSLRHCWVSRVRHHLQHPKHPKEANIQTATDIKQSNCGIC